ncbi:ribosome maturation factor RimP [Clostridium sp.]|uniref:ribosome maturation factor RimP n=1 Tax=Clostridium sp. TaxID=1506 RepID=UPI003F40E467
MKIDALIESIDQLVRPIADELNYEIYHIEYVKENGEYYLRIYIDKEGGIKLSDCEALSRRVSDIMDEKDPIKEAYFLEVSSPGLNRGLYTDVHFEKQLGKEVLVRFTKSLDGRKNVKGILKEVTNDSVVIEAEEVVTVPKDKIKSANLQGEI